MILRPFPWWAFPNLLLEAMRDVFQLTQAPAELIGLSALSAMSAVVQDRARVRRREKLDGPINIFTLSFGKTGERKSAVDRLFMAPLKQIEETMAAGRRAAGFRLKADLAVWQTRVKVLMADIAAAEREGEPLDDLRDKLEAMYRDKPKASLQPKWLLSDASPEAIALRLSSWPSAALISDEAGVIFNARTLRNLELINTLWDGGVVQVDRTSRPSIEVRSAVLTAGLMVQPEVFGRFMQKHGVHARASGFLARFMFAAPISTQGTRFLTAAPAATPGLLAWERRITEILTQTVELARRGPIIPITLDFDAAAQRAWEDFHNAVEAELSAWGFFTDISDGAAKIAENVARLAAGFHFIQGEEGPIPALTMSNAIEIGTWALLQYKLIFGTLGQVDTVEQDADDLYKWLWPMAMQGLREVQQRHILQFGPNRLRSKQRLEAALNRLYYRGVVCGQLRGRTIWVLLNFPSPQVGNGGC